MEIEEYLQVVGVVEGKKEWKYKTMYQFLLEKGKHFKCGGSSGRRGKPKECFANCTKMMGRYVEGFAKTEYGFIVHHAWLIRDEGVEEVTWKEDGIDYFGVEVESEGVLGIIRRSEIYGVLGNYKAGFPELTGELDKWVK